MQKRKVLMLTTLVFSGLATAAECTLPSKVISGSVTLEAGCAYEQPITIETSNTTLDCNNAVFTGRGNKIGLYINSRGRPLENVTVKNCTFINFKGGVRVGWSATDATKPDDHDELYKRTPQNIVLDSLKILKNDGVGVYVDDYATKVEIKNSTFENNEGVGIYLEHSSRNNHIHDNKFSKNGLRKNREAIAIDSSADNVIENNAFSGNSAGGIFLYKNCGEHMDGGRQVTRWQHSDNNQIRNNRFSDEKIGIWLASRQSRSLKSFACGDKPMDAMGNYFEDFANHNIVSNNYFINNLVGVRIEGDFNKIESNEFRCSAGRSIELPRTERDKLLGRPQVGNVLSENKEINCKVAAAPKK